MVDVMMSRFTIHEECNGRLTLRRTHIVHAQQVGTAVLVTGAMLLVSTLRAAVAAAVHVALQFILHAVETRPQSKLFLQRHVLRLQMIRRGKRHLQ